MAQPQFRSPHTPLVIERRSGDDRRRRSSFSLRSLLLGGRRGTIRRREDRQAAFYLDRYHQSLFAAIVLILFLSVMDAILTMLLIHHGAVEINPIMAFYLSVGPYTFLLVKYGLTCIGVLTLLMFRNFVLQSLGMRAGAFLYVVLAAFAGVVSWQLYLIHRIMI